MELTTNNKVTFILCVAPYHRDLVQRALDSVEAQTVASSHLIYYDEERRGPAYGRNELVPNVKTPFLVFLDADDWVEPQYVERTLDHWREGKYVYTDWLQEDTRHEAPDKPWCGGEWHVSTALIPTDWVIRVGGFDETLRGAEDTDFYMRMAAAGMCGSRLAEPLFHYGAEGQRAKRFVQSDIYKQTMLGIQARYKNIVGCCGQKTVANTPPPNVQFEGSILAEAKWAGNRQERGLATGILYPRAGNGRKVWVHEADVKIAPHHWRRVETSAPGNQLLIPNENNHVKAAPPTVVDIGSDMNALADELSKALFPTAPKAAPVVSAPPATVEPDVRGVINIAQGRLGNA